MKCFAPLPLLPRLSYYCTNALLLLHMKDSLWMEAVRPERKGGDSEPMGCSYFTQSCKLQSCALRASSSVYIDWLETTELWKLDPSRIKQENPDRFCPEVSLAGKSKICNNGLPNAPPVYLCHLTWYTNKYSQRDTKT